jgi:two-component system, chemotaxis family, chemotaxis protein CheY
MVDLKDSPILVVDDYAAMGRIVRALLVKIGFANIEFAPDGASAWEKLRDHPYGLIISDAKMEPMTGIELLHEVRRDDRLKSIPLIMVTGAVDADGLAAAKKTGVSDYIVKPCTAETLREKLAGVRTPPDGTL